MSSSHDPYRSERHGSDSSMVGSFPCISLPAFDFEITLSNALILLGDLGVLLHTFDQKLRAMMLTKI